MSSNSYFYTFFISLDFAISLELSSFFFSGVKNFLSSVLFTGDVLCLPFSWLLASGPEEGYASSTPPAKDLNAARSQPAAVKKSSAAFLFPFVIFIASSHSSNPKPIDTRSAISPSAPSKGLLFYSISVSY